MTNCAQCGKPLVFVDHTHDDGLKSDHAPRVTSMDCPDHGDDWRWRKCDHAGPISDDGMSQLRECEIQAAEGVMPDRGWCAQCPIPSDKELIEQLVGALTGASELFTDDDLHLDDEYECIGRAIDEALAAYKASSEPDEIGGGEDVSS